MLYHVTVDKVPGGRFTPRVPAFRAPGEDDTIPRVCFSDSINGCIQAMPQNYYLLRALLEIENQIGLIPVLFVYTIDERKIKEYKPPSELSKLVPDADVTREHWVMEEVVCEEGYIRIIDYESGKDRLGKVVVSKARYDLLQTMPDKSAQTIFETAESHAFSLHDILMVYFDCKIRQTKLRGLSLSELNIGGVNYTDGDEVHV